MNRVTKIKAESGRVRFPRICITVPITLRKRMLKYQSTDPEVNWSRVASRAFKRMIERQEEKNAKKTKKRAS